jgi:GNAT superfamily N-acetyltransferase
MRRCGMAYPVADVREAGPGDVPAIVALSGALFREDAGTRDPTMNLDWPALDGARYFADLLADEAAACWVAETAAGARAIGYLAARVADGDLLRPAKVATLQSMYVEEAYRGRGVGRELVGRFLAWAQGRGARMASVTAYASNGAAVRFYEREGFSPKELTLERAVGRA